MATFFLGLFVTESVITHAAVVVVLMVTLVGGRCIQIVRRVKAVAQ